MKKIKRTLTQAALLALIIPSAAFSAAVPFKNLSINCGYGGPYPFGHKLVVENGNPGFWLFDRELKLSEFNLNPQPLTQNLINAYSKVSGRILTGGDSVPWVVELLNPDDQNGMQARYIIFSDSCIQSNEPATVPFAIDLTKPEPWYEGSVTNCECQ